MKIFEKSYNAVNGITMSDLVAFQNKNISKLYTYAIVASEKTFL
jgi:hypothetical protein